MTAPRWILAGSGVLLLGVAAFFGWVLHTEPGARWVAARAIGVLGEKLAIGEVHGTLWGPLTVENVRYRDPGTGVDASIRLASVDVVLPELIAWRVHVRQANVEGFHLVLSEPTEPRPDDNKPFSLEPPIDVIVDQFTLRKANIERNGESLLIVDRAALIGRWAGNGIGIEKLEVFSPQGEIHVAGNVGHSSVYTGRATGRFRWQLSEKEYAGTVDLDSTPEKTNIDAKLTSPLTARITGSMQQAKNVPYDFQVRVPAFDPRDKLLPDSSLTSLGADVRAHGDLDSIEIRGNVLVDAEQLNIDPIRLRLEEKVVHIDALTLRHARHKGVLTASGLVNFAQDPFFADLATQWRDVEIPAQFAGQPLGTRGDVKIRGTLNQFDANGDLSIGPKGRVADIRIALKGTPEQIQLDPLTIVQKNGGLSAKGVVLLKPEKGWRLTAEAKRFDPGALLAGWNGSLGFRLETQGTLKQAGPDATLNLKDLEGTLRNRRIAGNADLAITPDKVVAGNLLVRSGGSVARVSGKRGKALDVEADLDVKTLDDWLPGAVGTLNANIKASGEWPKLRLTGTAQGRGLAMDEMSAGAVDVTADIVNPLHPDGTLSVAAAQIKAAGFELSTAKLDASGNEENHTFTFSANGNPVSTEFRAKGTRLRNGWSGTVEQLALAATDVERLELRQPAQITIDGTTFDISESCLANNQVSVCLSGQRDKTGELRAKYTLEHLPLSLVRALLKPDLPMTIDGVVEGQGEIRQDADGALFGNAVLTSASGSVSEAEADGEAPLLTYQDFRFAADLNGESARGSAHAVFGDGGGLDAEASLTNLRSTARSVEGKAHVAINSLAPITLFTPQLAAVKGRGEANATVSGLISDPKITGTAALREFGTELPVLGIQLKDGEIEGSLAEGGAIKISGRVTSGDGRLEIGGGAESLDAIEVTAKGKNFLAANIPGARVILAPDVQLKRTPERMDLTGSAEVTEAQIDLTKLPKGGATQASSDVVVIDDKVALEGSKSVPLHVNVSITLGSKVALVGFGLDAKVSGTVAIREEPETDTIGSGELRVEGTYKAYGQDLTITSGRLLFASTPISNPQVNIVAVRELTDVVAKLTVSGTAQRPLLEVSADPTMSQTQALSYLVTGKPIDQLGSGEGDVVQSAAQSLGGAAGNLLAKNLGKRLGVDEIGVENSSEIGGSAFTIGQYLSPRLYLSYGVGLFEPGQVVTLRYRLSRKVSVEASQGPLQQRAGINYRIER